MTMQKITSRFLELAKEGKFDKIQQELFSKDAKSTEPTSSKSLQSVQGLDKITEKSKKFNDSVEKMHSIECSAPQVAGNFFTCTMGMDITPKGQARYKMDEIAVYEVKNDKIISEQFFY